MELTSVIVNAFVIAGVGLLLHRGNQGVRGEVQGVRAELVQLEERLEMRMTRLEERLELRMARLEERLELRMTQLEQRLDRRIERLEASSDAVRSDLTQVAIALGIRRQAEGE